MGRMLLFSACLNASMLLAGAANAEWKPTRGEESRSVQGCSEKTTREIWVCIFIRCDSPRNLSLYFNTFGGPDISGATIIKVDNKEFKFLVSPEKFDLPLPHSSRADRVTSEFFDAVKVSSAVTFLEPNFAPGFNRIELKGSRSLIESVVKRCRGFS